MFAAIFGLVILPSLILALAFYLALKKDKKAGQNK